MKISCVSLRFWYSLAGQFLEAGQTGLALGLARLRVGAYPLQFLLHRLHVGVDLLVFGFQAGFLLLQPARVVALPRNAVAAVEFENPLGGVVEEVAVVGDGDDGAGEADEELFQPFDRFGVEVVGRFVEQQHVGLGEQQLAQRDAALFAAGEVADHGIPGRQAQRVGGQFHLRFGVGAGGGDDRLQPRLFLGQLVEIGFRVGVGGIDLVELGLRLHDFAERRFDFFLHRLVRIELRFLRQVADRDAGQVLHLAVVFLVHAGHDPQHGRLAGTVQAEQADLGAGEEGEGNILDDLPLGRDDLADAEHGHDVLSHWVSLLLRWYVEKGKSSAADVDHGIDDDAGTDRKQQDVGADADIAMPRRWRGHAIHQIVGQLVIGDPLG